MEEVQKEVRAKRFPAWAAVAIAGVIVVIGGLGISRMIGAKVAKRVVETVVEQNTGAKIDINQDGQSVKIESDEGSVEIGKTTKWPEDIPADIPKFPAANIVGAVKTNESWVVVFEEVEQKNVDDYVAQLESLGWETKVKLTSDVSVTQLEMGSLQIALAYEPDSNGLNFTIAPKD